MKFLRTAVLLYRHTSSVVPPHSRNWYETYIFDLSQGLAAFWFQQTNSQVLITGDVFDWADLPQVDFTKRGAIARTAMDNAHNKRQVDFSKYDMVCVVVTTPVNGGSTFFSFEGRRYGAIVIGVGTSFDFTAHEFGHQIALQHSFGFPYFQEPGAQPGEYGHLYCIMSAQAFGRTDPTFTLPGPPPPDPEYMDQGPCLNGATALAKGWAISHEYQLSSGLPAEFDIMSLGTRPGSFPRIVRIHMPSAETFTVEFRHNVDIWDRGLPSPLVCVNHAEGSTADKAHPGSGSATYRGSIRLPFTLGSKESHYYDPAGFNVEVLEWPSPSQVRVRISPKQKPLQSIVLDGAVESLRSEVMESGSHTFENHFCLKGDYKWSAVRHYQMANYTVRYRDARLFSVNWKIDGVPLAGTNGAININAIASFARPVPQGHRESRVVTLIYAIETLADGSRLRLFNDPADGRYTFHFGFDFLSNVGNYSGSTWETFDGETLDWDEDYKEALEDCLSQLREVGRRHVKVHAVLPPELWQPMGPEVQERVQSLLEAYTGAENKRDRAFVLGMLRQLVGRDNIKPIVIPSKARSLRPRPMEEHNDQRSKPYKS